MTTSIWTNEMTVDQALELPKGCYVATINLLSIDQPVEPLVVQQPVEPHMVAKSAEAIVAHFEKEGGEFKAYSQAQLVVRSQEIGVAWQDWGKLMLC